MGKASWNMEISHFVNKKLECVYSVPGRVPHFFIIRGRCDGSHFIDEAIEAKGSERRV